MWFILIYLFTLGLILGSFYNVVGLRIPENKSIVTPRSACPTCNHTLTWRELIPVFSFLWQNGKCRNCKSKISAIYPIMELLTGILFALSIHIIGFDLEIIVALTLVSLLHIITVSDLAYMVIPNKIVIIFFILFIIERIFIPLDPWYDPAIGSVTAFLLLLLIATVSKGGMGGGDIKLFAVLGVALGLKLVLLAFFFATLLGAIVGGLGMLIGRAKRGKPIPFGPFIALGALIAYFYGNELIDWYISTLIN